MKEYVDLHVHSCHSDGSMTPAEIVEQAVAHGVGVLAIADHDMLEGSRAAEGLCKKAGIRYIPAVEMDTLKDDTNFHILGYGVDLQDAAFERFVQAVRFSLDESSVKLVEAMERDHATISFAEYMDYAYDARKGGWKALHYLLDKGVSTSLKGGIALYQQYGMTYQQSGYPTIRATCHRIRQAKGYAVLAHPGELLDTRDPAAFRAALVELIGLGLDGVECYYPSHTDEVTAICVDVCKTNGLLITTGSDCHGTFGKTTVGEMRIGLDKLQLKELL